MIRFLSLTAVCGLVLLGCLGVLVSRFTACPMGMAAQDTGKIDAWETEREIEGEKEQTLHKKRDLLQARLEQIEQKLNIITDTSITVLFERLSSGLAFSMKNLRGAADALQRACRNYDVEDYVYRQAVALQRRISQSRYLPPGTQAGSMPPAPSAKGMHMAAMDFANAWNDLRHEVERVRIEASDQFAQLRMEIANTLNEAAQLEIEALSGDMELQGIRREILQLMERIQAYTEIEAATTRRALPSLAFDGASWQTDIVQLTAWIQSTLSADAIQKRAEKMVQNDSLIQSALHEIEARSL